MTYPHYKRNVLLSLFRRGITGTWDSSYSLKLSFCFFHAFRQSVQSRSDILKNSNHLYITGTGALSTSNTARCVLTAICGGFFTSFRQIGGRTPFILWPRALGDSPSRIWWIKWTMASNFANLLGAQGVWGSWRTIFYLLWFFSGPVLMGKLGLFFGANKLARSSPFFGSGSSSSEELGELQLVARYHALPSSSPLNNSSDTYPDIVIPFCDYIQH